MARFNYTPFNTTEHPEDIPSTQEDIVFDSSNGYSDPSNESETRKQLSTPLFQLKKFLNSLFDSSDRIPMSNLNIPSASSQTSGLMTVNDKDKLDGIESGAEPNVIETVKINGTALTPSDKAVNIPNATNSSSGLMTSDEKIKLATIEQGAQANVIETVQLNGSSITPLNKTVDITITNATQAWDGLMPKGDKKKLDNATSEVTPLKPANLVKRDSNGRFRAEAPSDSKDVANKAYVDEHVLPDPTNYPEGTVMVVYADYYGVKHWTAMQLWNGALIPIKPEPLPPE